MCAPVADNQHSMSSRRDLLLAWENAENKKVRSRKS